ncbi:DgyrCDS6738 [Dimorphilus gyrociliatus]|uniref:DgyrCDS6738 n=1 Tax=Dimorphilus gyrociliatus TaxID=2664684 RepID=A0A7I8VPJ4_9ANNE|nr:DgyrCDS6738 [Dimorphilus gyrociliatus]
MIINNLLVQLTIIAFYAIKCKTEGEIHLWNSLLDMYEDLNENDLQIQQRTRLKDCKYKVFQSYHYGFPKDMTFNVLINSIRDLINDGYSGYKSGHWGKIVITINFADFFNQIATKCFEIEPNNPNCIWEMTSAKKALDNYEYNNIRGKSSMAQKLSGVPYSDEELSVIITFLECIERRSKSSSFIYHHEINCPNPCLKKPCMSIDYAIHDSCQIAFPGAQENQFICLCQQYFEWSSSSLKCIEEAVCAEAEGICKNDGICVRDAAKISTGFVCKCTETHFGRTCEAPRNACIERYKKKLKPGNQLCGGYDIEDGKMIEVYPGMGKDGRLGECKPILGTDSFGCLCYNGFRHDEKVSKDPNCRQKYSAVCDSSVCPPEIGRKCREGKCVCANILEINTLELSDEISCSDLEAATEWLPWGPCEPHCTTRPELKRYKKRQRNGCALKDGKYCHIMQQALILTEQIERCDNIFPCKIDGTWSTWKDWTKCSFICGNQATKTRVRLCYYNTSFDFRQNTNLNRRKVFFFYYYY